MVWLGYAVYLYIYTRQYIIIYICLYMYLHMYSRKKTYLAICIHTDCAHKTLELYSNEGEPRKMDGHFPGYLEPKISQNDIIFCGWILTKGVDFSKRS